ncbi:transcriptional adapter 2-alpha-like isoform X1 [Stegodyphus dumicola]|uniref:transcriptional adapter 2-alpha-like isoform X1 n=1 Tax=Stegodyphus dumicola TaxID=202533 RepID=UPI0015A985FF|nr:transcriptional adapter 2-alpha-like isoform X1 [Stegodyphus dumicola]XP_035234128.1 transcriptional adapter 2-alpha-like isoform X1 [Stegodyphus dumicola]
MGEALACPICGIFLIEPYVRCAKCKNPTRSFCLQCFAKGREYESHRNNHPYTIVRNNFTLFNPEWMASEELKLLDAIAERGIGNWSDIAKDVGTKGKTECEEHYFKYYVYNPVPPLPKIPEPEIESNIHSTPVACTTFSQDPPRPVIGSAMYQEMAGYMPARGDFSSEYDDYAELDIKDLSYEKDDPFWNEMQSAVLSIYQSRLKERARKKWIIMTYGLISMKRNLEDWKRYSILGKTILDKMKTFMRLLAPDDFYKFLEGVLWEQKTKQRIRMLQDCRNAGITHLHSIGTYMKLKRRREERRRYKTALDEVLGQIKDEASCHQFIRRQFLKESSQGVSDAMAGVGRRSAPPLNIIGMPGYEKLTTKERELCANLRLFPNSFLNYKDTLINEYRKLGSLRLANARTVIKIDVNKTRKIYDLLLEEGLVSKSS